MTDDVIEIVLRFLYGKTKRFYQLENKTCFPVIPSTLCLLHIGHLCLSPPSGPPMHYHGTGFAVCGYPLVCYSFNSMFITYKVHNYSSTSSPLYYFSQFQGWHSLQLSYHQPPEKGRGFI